MALASLPTQLFGENYLWIHHYQVSLFTLHAKLCIHRKVLLIAAVKVEVIKVCKSLYHFKSDLVIFSKSLTRQSQPS